MYMYILQVSSFVDDIVFLINNFNATFCVCNFNNSNMRIQQTIYWAESSFDYILRSLFFHSSFLMRKKENNEFYKKIKVFVQQ